MYVPRLARAFLGLCAAMLAFTSSWALPPNIGPTEIGDTAWSPTPGDQGKVIYGADDRIDVFEETDLDRLTLAASTCALIQNSRVVDNGNSTFTIQTNAFTYIGLPPCAGEPFASQPTSAFCSGFLVGPDLIVTAGHCSSAGPLGSIRFVFGFDMLNATTPALTVDASQVYTGIETVGHVFDTNNGNDYWVIRLDRDVNAPGAIPLPIRRTGTIAPGEQVGVIGHPSGLPKKIAFGNQTVVTASANPIYFEANVDTYAGNSGSPVFNQATGVVEGILVRGEPDFDIIGSCFVSNELPDALGSEDCTKTTVFAGLIPEIPVDPEIPTVPSGARTDDARLLLVLFVALTMLGLFALRRRELHALLKK